MLVLERIVICKEGIMTGEFQSPLDNGFDQRDSGGGPVVPQQQQDRVFPEPQDGRYQVPNPQYAPIQPQAIAVAGLPRHKPQKRNGIFTDGRFWIGVGSGVGLSVVSLFALYQIGTYQLNHDVLHEGYSACSTMADKNGDVMQLADGGKTLTLETGADDISSYECLAENMNIPKSLQTKIGATTGLSGSQTDSWDGVQITWSYSGSNGLSMVFETEE